MATRSGRSAVVGFQAGDGAASATGGVKTSFAAGAVGGPSSAVTAMTGKHGTSAVGDSLDETRKHKLTQQVEDYGRILDATEAVPNYPAIKALFEGNEGCASSDTVPNIHVSFELFETVQNRFANTKQVLERTKADLLARSQQYSQLQAELQRLQGDFAVVKNRATEAEERNTALHQQTAKLEVMIEQLQKEAGQMRTEMSLVQDKLVFREEELQVSQNRVAEGLVTISQKEAAIATLRRELAKYGRFQRRGGTGNRDGRKDGEGGEDGDGEYTQEALESIAADVEGRSKEARMKLNLADLEAKAKRTELEKQCVLQQHDEYRKHVEQVVSSLEAQTMEMHDAITTHACATTPFFLSSSYYDALLHPERHAAELAAEDAARQIGKPPNDAAVQSFYALTYESRRALDRLQKINIDADSQLRDGLCDAIAAQQQCLQTSAELIGFLSTLEKEVTTEKLSLPEVREEWRKAQVPFFASRVAKELTEGVAMFSRSLVRLLQQENDVYASASHIAAAASSPTSSPPGPRTEGGPAAVATPAATAAPPAAPASQARVPTKNSGTMTEVAQRHHVAVQAEHAADREDLDRHQDTAARSSTSGAAAATVSSVGSEAVTPRKRVFTKNVQASVPTVDRPSSALPLPDTSASAVASAGPASEAHTTAPTAATTPTTAVVAAVTQTSAHTSPMASPPLEGAATTTPTSSFPGQASPSTERLQPNTTTTPLPPQAELVCPHCHKHLHAEEADATTHHRADDKPASVPATPSAAPRRPSRAPTPSTGAPGTAGSTVAPASTVTAPTTTTASATTTSAGHTTKADVPVVEPCPPQTRAEDEALVTPAEPDAHPGSSTGPTSSPAAGGGDDRASVEAVVVVPPASPPAHSSTPGNVTSPARTNDPLPAPQAEAVVATLQAEVSAYQRELVVKDIEIDRLRALLDGARVNTAIPVTNSTSPASPPPRPASPSSSPRPHSPAQAGGGGADGGTLPPLRTPPAQGPPDLGTTGSRLSSAGSSVQRNLFESSRPLPPTADVNGADTNHAEASRTSGDGEVLKAGERPPASPLLPRARTPTPPLLSGSTSGGARMPSRPTSQRHTPVLPPLGSAASSVPSLVSGTAATPSVPQPSTDLPGAPPATEGGDTSHAKPKKSRKQGAATTTATAATADGAAARPAPKSTRIKGSLSTVKRTAGKNQSSALASRPPLASGVLGKTPMAAPPTHASAPASRPSQTHGAHGSSHAPGTVTSSGLWPPRDESPNSHADDDDNNNADDDEGREGAHSHAPAKRQPLPINVPTHVGQGIPLTPQEQKAYTQYLLAQYRRMQLEQRFAPSSNASGAVTSFSHPGVGIVGVGLTGRGAASLPATFLFNNVHYDLTPYEEYQWRQAGAGAAPVTSSGGPGLSYSSPGGSRGAAPAGTSAPTHGYSSAIARPFLTRANPRQYRAWASRVFGGVGDRHAQPGARRPHSAGEARRAGYLQRGPVLSHAATARQPARWPGDGSAADYLGVNEAMHVVGLQRAHDAGRSGQPWWRGQRRPQSAQLPTRMWWLSRRDPYTTRNKISVRRALRFPTGSIAYDGVTGHHLL